MNFDCLRKYCLSFTAASEDEKWGHLCFCVQGKIFCISDFEESGAVCFKVTEEDFNILTEIENITQAPHFAKRQWVSIANRNSLNQKEWEHYLQQSYQLVVQKLPKKISTFDRAKCYLSNHKINFFKYKIKKYFDYKLIVTRLLK